MHEILEQRLKKSKVKQALMEAKEALKLMTRPDTPELPRYIRKQASILWQ